MCHFTDCVSVDHRLEKSSNNTQTHERKHSRTHARTHAHTHTPTHTHITTHWHTHTHTHTHTHELTAGAEDFAHATDELARAVRVLGQLLDLHHGVLTSDARVHRGRLGPVHARLEEMLLVVERLKHTTTWHMTLIIIIIIDNFCIALFSGVPKLTALHILQHFLSFTNIIHIIMTTNNV